MRNGKTVKFEAGEILFSQGEAGDFMLLLEEGNLGVIKDGQLIATLGPGSTVGEMAILLNEPRIASVKALTKAKLITITAGDFERVLQERPDISLRIMESLARQLQNTTNKLMQARAIMAVV